MNGDALLDRETCAAVHRVRAGRHVRALRARRLHDGLLDLPVDDAVDPADVLASPVTFRDALGAVHRRQVAVESPWCDLSDDGGGLCLLDHPGNPRHPVPWYGATRSRVCGDGWANYLNAAFLFHAPLVLPAGERLTLRYRIVVHDAAWDVDRAQAAWQQWVS